jgi:ketosteroid isomerase-like protein
MPGMRADEVVRGLWERIQARDWPALRALLAPEVVLEWPATGERFEGPDAVVAVNKDYPEGWSIDVVRVVPSPDGETVVSEVEVPHADMGTFAVASFWRVRDGRVTACREYWVQCGAEQAPAWRARYASRYSGRPRDTVIAPP